MIVDKPRENMDKNYGSYMQLDCTVNSFCKEQQQQQHSVAVSGRRYLTTVSCDRSNSALHHHPRSYEIVEQRNWNYSRDMIVDKPIENMNKNYESYLQLD